MGRGLNRIVRGAKKTAAEVGNFDYSSTGRRSLVFLVSLTTVIGTASVGITSALAASAQLQARIPQALAVTDSHIVPAAGVTLPSQATKNSSDVQAALDSPLR